MPRVYPMSKADLLTIFTAAIFAATILPRAAAESKPQHPTKAHATDEVTDFRLLDTQEQSHQLRRQTDAKAVVLMITGNGCPIVRQNGPKFQSLKEKFSGKRIRFWMINANSQDDLASLRTEANKLSITIPVLKDESQLVAYSLGVQRTAEVIAINTKDWSIFYRGAIDDQLVEGASKPAPTVNYLEDALQAFLGGKEIAEPKTRAAGCIVHYEGALGKPATVPGYAHDVAPILASRCASCHSEGNIGTFNMSDYKTVKGYSDTLREWILNKQMPPWHADPHYGKFRDDRSLPVDEARTLVRWVDAGCPRGDGEDSLVALARNPPQLEGWVLGKPDYIVRPTETMKIPATGTVEYITNIVESPILEDAWLHAAVIRPDNKKVLHHAIVYLEVPEKHGKGEVDVWLAGWGPGYRMAAYPEGTGKFLPKGAKLRWQIHYTTEGSEQTDLTELGLYLLKEKPPVEIHVLPVLSPDFRIQPNNRDSRTMAVREFHRDTMLYEMNPHMHKRGSWFRFEALYPDGKFETLLSVPKYDFNWQTGYVLAEPKLLPAGTRILCTGGFDNSRHNPSNPDPNKEVVWGEQSWEEMFIGFITVAETPAGSTHSAKPVRTASVP